MKSEQFVRNAYHCILQNDFEGALQWFEAAVLEDPDSAEIHYRCSVTYARSSRLEKALEHAQKAFELAPEKSEYLLYLQHLQSMRLVQDAKKIIDSGKVAPASELYQTVSKLKEAVKLDPLYGEAYIWLALTYSQLNEHALAIASLKEVIALQPHDHGLHEMLDQLKHRLSSYLHD
ncbi:tetratricopeptide repeat protein [Paenibacillus sp. HJL G12]|uniref:Tetratricopeptide repeat protein n=1 Tax=Paenibacillus dendrobii TaxID=2691084 RepID=A0A7X3LHY1_9BACL|nr:tetratricopeptide repeat protein [Paenibacillus dendrobii]MWV44690.1 tetratricopeptide repeat protein [Paenibacillus dendrobii]